MNASTCNAQLQNGWCPSLSAVFAFILSFLAVIAVQSPVTAHISRGALITWLSFNISSSQLFLPLLVAALSFAKPKAEPTLINLVLTWIVYGLVSSVLWVIPLRSAPLQFTFRIRLYSGHAEGCEPPPLLCLSQASLYIAVPPM